MQNPKHKEFNKNALKFPYAPKSTPLISRILFRWLSKTVNIGLNLIPFSRNKTIRSVV